MTENYLDIDLLLGSEESLHFGEVGLSSLGASRKRSPVVFEDRLKQPRIEEGSTSQFSLCSDIDFDVSLSSLDSLAPTSPESGVDVHPPLSGGSFFMTNMEGILSKFTEHQHPPAGIEIVEEPEQNYRPRYESEGHRAPMKGRRNKASFPSIKIVNVPEHTTGTVQVSLVQVDNNQSYPSCNLSGETEKIVGSSAELIVKFSDLRIQRIISNDMSRKAAKGKSNQAKLLFRANLKTVEGYITLEASSQPIFLEPAQGRGILSAIVPSRGSAKGGDEFVLLGHKFTAPCKVEFSATINGQEWKSAAEICKDKFPPAKNAILAKVPRCFQSDLKKPVTVNVTVYTGRDNLESENHLQFTYVPPDGGISNPETLVQCALPLISEGRKLLEPSSFSSIPTSTNNGYIPSTMHPTSPPPDNWAEQIPGNNVPTVGDRDVLPYSTYTPASNCMPPLSATSSMPPCSPFYSQSGYSSQHF